jgi:cytochrome c oxidase subunit III
VTTRPVIDASRLPASAFGSQEPSWWGNTLFMLIETVSVVLLIVSYFYVIQNFPEWPPPAAERNPPVYRPMPDLSISSWVAGLLVVATIPMVWADFGAHKLKKFPVLTGLSLGLVAGTIALILRFYEFGALKFRWDENAYASIVWGLLVLHLLYLLFEVAEVGINIVWILLHGLDEKHAIDVTLSTAYWYWTMAIGTVIYGVVYWSPRILS